MSTQTPLTRQEQICFNIGTAISERAQDNRHDAIEQLREAYNLTRPDELTLKAALNDATKEIMDRETCISHCKRARDALDVDPEAAAERVGWSA